jgi:hypothetical protein
MDATCKEECWEGGTLATVAKIDSFVAARDRGTDCGGWGPVSLADHFDHSLGYAQINPPALSGGHCTTWCLLRNFPSADVTDFAAKL